MQTSCPECCTTFRVSQEQLGLRRGLVRCGHCNAVFNAYDTLLPELESAPATQGEAQPKDLPEVEAAPEGTALADVEAAYREAGISVAAQGALTAYTETAAVPEVPEPEQEAAQEEEPPAAKAEAVVAETPDAILLSDLPNRRVAGRARLPRWKTVLYLFVVVLLALGLLGQSAYFLRGELAAALPEARPMLNALCRPLGCVVPLPQQLTRQAIVSSSLEHDAEQKSRVRLSFLLANRTHQSQTWPHVILTLSDVRESPVAQKAFAPHAYLPPGISVRAGFPAQSEQEARVDMDIGSLAAASYVLTIAYP